MASLTLQRFVNAGHATNLQEVVAILGGVNLILAEIVRDGVALIAVRNALGVLNLLAILEVELLHFLECAMVPSTVMN